MAADLNFTSCRICGAVVGVVSTDGGGFSNLDQHLEWHRGQDELAFAP